MKFNFFHLMPWTGMTEAGTDWPVPNKHFDPVEGTETYRRYIDTMAHAEDCGFDLIGCNEHHFSPYGLMANPNLIGSILATRTKTAKIALFGNLIALNNPIRVAEEYAMIDVISGGRLVAGFMRGIPHEYVAYNVNPSESWERMNEATELIIKAWTEPEPFGWEGKHYQFPSVSIWPRPRQQPHPQIMMSASNPESAVVAARHRAIMGIVLISNLDNAKESIRVYKETARTYGWEPGPENILIGQHLCLCDTDEEALEMLKKGEDYYFRVLGGGPRTASRLVLQESRFYETETQRNAVAARRQALATGTIADAVERGQLLCGSPRSVIKQIKRLHGELGMGILHCTMHVGNMTDAAVRNGMRLFKEQVWPEVRGL